MYKVSKSYLFHSSAFTASEREAARLSAKLGPPPLELVAAVVAEIGGGESFSFFLLLSLSLLGAVDLGKQSPM
jgi:hypothetical protein